MAGGQPLRELVTRRAASFLRAARLALTGATPAPQLLTEEEAINGDGGGCHSRYQSVSTKDDDVESGGDEDESESTLLLAGEEEHSRMTCACVHGDVHVNKLVHEFRHWPANIGESLSGDVAAEEESEPLMPRRAAAKRANNAGMVDHPFGGDRRGRSSSSSRPLLVTS
ncbi:hypothetical protein ACP70R_032349 [Stipagrostis hirtigluma subsp. patula]